MIKLFVPSVAGSIPIKGYRSYHRDERSYERIAETERSITAIVESIEECENDQGVFEREYEDQSTITSGSPSPTGQAYSTTVSRCSDDL